MKFILSLITLMSFNVFGHGENKPGPHGGHIRMPGPFHTELLLESQSAKVYLLDIKFKKLTTKKSTVSLGLHAEGKTDEVNCLDKETHFECAIPGKISQYSGIQVNTIRNGIAGKGVHYRLPLSFSRSEHSQHNH